MILFLSLLLHQPPPLPLALVRAWSSFGAEAQKSQTLDMGGQPVVGAGGVAEGRSRQQAVCLPSGQSQHGHKAAPSTCSCTLREDPASRGLPECWGGRIHTLAAASASACSLQRTTRSCCPPSTALGRDQSQPCQGTRREQLWLWGRT